MLGNARDSHIDAEDEAQRHQEAKGDVCDREEGSLSKSGKTGAQVGPEHERGPRAHGGEAGDNHDKPHHHQERDALLVVHDGGVAQRVDDGDEAVQVDPSDGPQGEGVPNEINETLKYVQLHVCRKETNCCLNVNIFQQCHIS